MRWARAATRGRAQAALTALLPRNTTVVSAEGLTDPSYPGSAIQRTDANLAARPAIAWFWQNDPLFRVRYRYA